MIEHTQTKERLIDRLRNELYKKHNWTGETAVNYMVPIILAIRHKDDERDPEAILGALHELRDRGKRELDDTLNAVRERYQGVSPLLRKTLGGMITSVGDLPDGIIYDILDYLHRNQPLLYSLRDEDFIGTLFERSVSDAFRGDDGRFFTPRNIILIVREMMRLLLTKEDPDKRISDYTVCDPCCGSARFLIYWSELLIHEIRSTENLVEHPKVLKRLEEIATQSLFGADIHPDTAAYGCLNMMLHGDGATNIARLDSLDHFGFFADLPLLRSFADEFEKKWEIYRCLPGVSNSSDLRSSAEVIEQSCNAILALQTTSHFDLLEPKWIDVMKAIRALRELDREYATEWDAIRAIQRRYKHPAVFETMIDEWARARNPRVAHGFDVIITNPPFGRQADLMVDDAFILSQYKLATELWVSDLTKTRVEDLLSRTLAIGSGLPTYYVGLMNMHFSKYYVETSDDVHFSKLPPQLLEKIIDLRCVKLESYVSELVVKMRKRLRRTVGEQLKEQCALLDPAASDYKEKDKALRKHAQDERNQLDSLTIDELKRKMAEQGLGWASVLYKREMVDVVTQALDRSFVTEDDKIPIDQLPESEILRVCGEYLYENNKPSDVLAGEIIAYFGKEWLTVEDIEGPDAYASTVTLVFNGEPHTIYYDDDGLPIVYKRPLPKQVLFVEQFLRMVRPGGKVFTVLDTGVLSNIGDEYVRQFIYRNARVHAIVEFPHGAFKAAEANVKTAIVLLEKLQTGADYEFFGSLPEFLGYRLNDQNVPPIPENDLGKVLCDYSRHLDLGPLLPDCATRNTEFTTELNCGWYRTRSCDFWKKHVEHEEM